MSYIAPRLENVTDPKKEIYPGDYILEVRVVYASGAEGKVFSSTITSQQQIETFRIFSSLLSTVLTILKILTLIMI